MTAIAELSFPTEAYPLGEAVRVPEGTRVELERLVPTGEGVLPYLWVWSETPDRFVAHLRAQPAVDDVAVVYRDAGDVLIRAGWQLAPGTLLHFLAGEDVALVSATGTADGWVVELRSERDVLRRIERFCRERAIEMTLRRVYEATALEALEREPSGTPEGLTRLQHETLVRALEAGYFEEPREVTLEELAADLGVSSRAVSRRLRRGVANVLRGSLIGER
ncbi:helix-turn-helix domain-containing protein [Salinirubellus salinus]|uniref:Helix-turn-helix domain-containing protein n=1 Tax=Salinirubellus salinus TaxID=1364945 RepID=A0A9E7R3Q7_9EURY|nr:helix-turn-helix domain-containing protein [Salinirubellus salinus]UWM54100.1 helix-turn-helix domain-containing protein [Salinirubellus salinus]